MNNMDRIQSEKNKAQRGKIIRTLGLFYPDPMELSALKSTLIQSGQINVAETEKHLHYLKGKDYITMDDGFLKDTTEDDLICLTSTGVDLVEGTIDDPGVML